MRPFIGKAGQKLRDELRKHSAFTRRNTLISNVLACRPLNNIFPKNGTGEHFKIDGSKHCKARELVNFCATKWLRREISIVQPKVIITLGSQALDYVRGDRGITSHRGTWKFLPVFQAWSMATYHPSYVIRCLNDTTKEHIPYQFSEDITKIARGWRDVVDEDPRMKMSKEEWQRERALDVAISRGLYTAVPIDD
jgi:uracil-DNA glycosylase